MNDPLMQEYSAAKDYATKAKREWPCRGSAATGTRASVPACGPESASLPACLI